MKLSQDQKGMLMLGTLALIGILAFTAASKLSAGQVGSTLGFMSGGVGMLVMVFAVFFVLLLMVLGVLIPLFIYFIYGDVRKMREIAERNERKIEQLRVDFATLKQMWQR